MAQALQCVLPYNALSLNFRPESCTSDYGLHTIKGVFMGFSTDAIHAGQEPDPTTGAITTPIFATSTYVLPALGKTKGYDYARTINTTRAAREKNLATLEGGAAGYCFASGMAAISAVMTLLRAGDHVVASDKVYGGT